MTTKVKSRAELAANLVSHMHHAYLQTNGTMQWPNSREGDMLRGAYGILTARLPSMVQDDEDQAVAEFTEKCTQQLLRKMQRKLKAAHIPGGKKKRS